MIQNGGRIEPYKRRRLTKNKIKLGEYKKAFIETYNDLTLYLRIHSITAKIEEKIDIDEKQLKILTRLKVGLSLLHLQYEFGTSIFSTIDINKVTSVKTDESKET